VRPTQDAVAAVEEPYRRRLREVKFRRLAEEAQSAHLTPPARRTPTQAMLVQKTERLLTVTPQEVLAALSAADRARVTQLRAALRRFDAQKPAALPVAMGLWDGAAIPPRTFVLKRGELGNCGDEVQPGFPAVLAPDNQPVPAAHRRAALADWVASSDNPLTARVLVNRLWQHHFGRGIVPTPSDFGLRGERPTHPELLDWLATEFVQGGWSIKRLHRLILLSAAYRQSSHVSPAARARDPENRLFSRMNRLRLEGEVIRDGLLAVSGRLNRTLGGPGVLPQSPADPRVRGRRSIYLLARRNVRFPFLETFDLPDSTMSCPRRECSVTAPQALTLLNSAEVREAAEALAGQLLRQGDAEPERVRRAYRLALGREPLAQEIHWAREFLRQSPWPELCRALFNVNEFIYVD
jgi:hypothetical protein